MKSSCKLYISLIVILLFSFMTLFVTDVGMTYYRIVRPLLWGAFLILLAYVSNNRKLVYPYKKQVTYMVIVSAIANFVIYFTFGYITGFANNPFDTSALGLLLNFIYYIPVIVVKEIVRSILLENINSERAIRYILLIALVFTISDVETYSILFTLETLNEWVEFIFRTMFVNLCLNLYFTYNAYYSSFIGNIIYRIIPVIFMLFLPFLPNIPWALAVIVDVIIPFVFFFIIDRYVSCRDYKDIEYKKLKIHYEIFLVPFALIVVFCIFGLGYLKVVPVAIATDSMVPEFKRGDAVVIDKKFDDKIKVGDIIQYRLENITIIHRVIEIKNDNGKRVYITKGDNNNSVDIYPVKESQILGKLKFVIPNLGYPSLWINEWGSKEVDEIPVEVGKK